MVGLSCLAAIHALLSLAEKRLLAHQDPYKEWGAGKW